MKKVLFFIVRRTSGNSSLFYVGKLNVVKSPRDNLLQHILITNPIIVFDPVDTLDVQKSESIVVLLTEKNIFQLQHTDPYLP